MRRGSAAVLAALLFLAAAACGSGETAVAVRLDGSPRPPDDEGVVTDISRDELTLDGERSYDVSPALRSFSAQTLAIEPMLSREGQYVQVGLDGDDRVVWMGGVGSVVRTMDPPSAFFTGAVEEIDDDRVVFENGTVLTLASDAAVEAKSGRVAARIDVERGVVIELRPT